jgi:hypothetical protein
MPIYFQKISTSNFNPDGNFYVKDSKGCNMTMGFLFLVAFLLTVYIDRFNTNDLSIYQLFYLSIIPGVYLIKRGMINKIIITINKSGFYYFDKLITDWNNFIDAFVAQDEENRRIPYDVTDRFILVIRYGKIGHTGYFGRKIVMTATMDKSEEEIMAAIKFYYEHREQGTIIPYKPEASSRPPILYLPQPPQTD